MEAPWTLSVKNILADFAVNPNQGLSPSQVKKQRQAFGKNKIESQKIPSWLVIFARQFKSLLIALLALAAIVAGITGDVIDAIAILLVLLVNSLIGFITEIKAISSMESLRKMGQTTTRVLRNSSQQLVISKELVPGDIILLEAGDVISADCRLIDSHNLNVDESALTGESVPVEKTAKEGVAQNSNISERHNMLMKGTHITKGTCKGVVTSTGMQTELGKIAALTADAKEEVTPLEKRLDKLGKKLLWLTLFISVFIFVSGMISGKDFVLMVQTAIALAVATVPEGLPIVATIALAKGLWTMAKKNALINKLSAVETLGATSIIVSDKTGTLTKNEMTVSELIIPNGSFFVKQQGNKLTVFSSDGESLSYSSFSSEVRMLVTIIGLCNDAQYRENSVAIGDPMEIALKRFAIEISGKNFESEYPRISEVPFDTNRKMMATIHKNTKDMLVAVKGAPEVVLSACKLSEEEQKRWKQKNNELANRGLRVLAIAYKDNFQNEKTVYKSLSFLGLVGLIDPAREEVPGAISQCQNAGIRVIMATGDQAGTATKIANDIGLVNAPPISGQELIGQWSEELKNKIQNASVFSRVSPEQKLRLVEYYQGRGSVVAMTGDGVNDAPALKKADIGVAMGKRGTQVAREASDMILKDDRFETIVHAIEQGRIIFENIRKFVIYLLSCNISEVLIIGLASIFSANLPITPLQILFLNLVTDVFPALALGMGQGDSSYLSKHPRSSEEKILENRHWNFIFFYGGIITATVLATFYLHLDWLQLPLEKAVTISFLTLGISQLFHVFNLRKSGSGLLVNEITKNIHVWGAVLFCLLIFFASVTVPILQKTLELTSLSLQDWLIVFAASLIPLLGQFVFRLK